jgi:creatinine amidohydrolase
MTETAPKARKVADLTWDIVAERIASGDAALLPVGAGAKQHGLHMRMATDQVFAEYFAGVVAEETGALIWPTLTYGAYTAFVAYAGSASLSDATFQSAVTEIANALLGFGAQRVLILDTGISTLAPVAAAIKASSDPSRIRHLKVFAGPRFVQTAKALQQQPYGSHADEIETSLMLAIAPGLVDMSRAKASPVSPGGPSHGPLSPDDPKSPNFRQAAASAIRRWPRPRRARQSSRPSSRI